MDRLSETQAVRELIGHCLAGDRDATRRFQQAYGELIYGYPIRVYRTPPDEAGDFYVFAFDGGRIFRRVRTYEGRAPFRAYLLGFVLDDLVLEWKRGERHLETVSMEEFGDFADPHALDHSDPGDDTAMNSDLLGRMVASLDPAKAVVLKLLYVEDCELSAPELQWLAESTQRTVAEVVKGVEELRARVREREAIVKNLEDTLAAVQAWIDLYERRRQRVLHELAGLAPNAAAVPRLRAEHDELQRKIDRRRRQQAKLIMQSKRRKVTAPYKDIAALMNTTVGNVGSQIARLRQELSAKGLRGEAVARENEDRQQP